MCGRNSKSSSALFTTVDISYVSLILRIRHTKNMNHFRFQSTFFLEFHSLSSGFSLYHFSTHPTVFLTTTEPATRVLTRVLCSKTR